jgi:6-phosphogluconolactonase
MRLVARVVLGVISALAFALAADQPPKGGEYIVFIGTYTRTKSKGIYAYRFQPSTGKVSFIGRAAETPNPSWLAVHPSLKYLYATNESEIKPAPGQPNTVSSFAIDRKSGALTFLNKVSVGGRGPCHVSVDKTGKTLFAANYGSGNVEAISILADGRLGGSTAHMQHVAAAEQPGDPARKVVPHAHCVMASPDNRFLLATDLGLDQIFSYRLDAAKGTLAPNDPPFARVTAGAGPRHFAFHPDGRFLYVINEYASTVTAFAYQAGKGAITEIQTVSALPQSFAGKNTGAAIQVDRSGKFLYASNRGHDSIAVFAIDSKKGTLTLLETVPSQGLMPRSFSLDPTGGYLFAANQNGNSIVLFRVDAKTGRLTPTGQVIEDSPEPTCVLFVPAL